MSVVVSKMYQKNLWNVWVSRTIAFCYRYLHREIDLDPKHAIFFGLQTACGRAPLASRGRRIYFKIFSNVHNTCWGREGTGCKTTGQPLAFWSIIRKGVRQLSKKETIRKRTHHVTYDDTIHTHTHTYIYIFIYTDRTLVYFFTFISAFQIIFVCWADGRAPQGVGTSVALELLAEHGRLIESYGQADHVLTSV